MKTAAILPSVCQTFHHKEHKKQVVSLLSISVSICDITIIKKTNTVFNAFIEASCGVGAGNIISSSALAKSITLWAL